MVCKSDEFSGAHDHNKRWTNWNQNIQFAAEEYFEPDGLLSLVHVVARATDEQKRLKAIGSGWSFEDIAKSDDWVVSLKGLTRRLDYVIGSTGAALNQNWKNLHFDPHGTRRLVHVEAGIEIGALNTMLAADGLAMRTLGGSNGQSIAGAISTSTHGGDWQEPPLPDFVRAIHLVTDGGREIWIERQSEPITGDDDLLRSLLPCEETDIVRNDDIFNAVLVSCGRCGVIYAFVLEVRAAFRVVEVTTKPDRTMLIQSLRDGIAAGDFFGPLFTFLNEIPPPADLIEGKPASDVEGTGVMAHAPSFVQLLFSSVNPQDCWVQRRWVTPVTRPVSNVVQGEWGPDGLQVFAAADWALASAGSLAVAFPVIGPVWATAIALAQAEMRLQANGRAMSQGDALELALNAMWRLPFFGDAVKGLVKWVLDGRYGGSMAEGRRGAHHLITSGTAEDSHNLPFRGDFIEVVFDATTTSYVDFLDAVLVAAPAFKQAGYISVRFSASSKATLSMHGFASARAVSIEVATWQGLPDNAKWIELVQTLSLPYGGRPHWGQFNNLNELQVTALYGKNLIAWREALLRVSDKSLTFSNHFTRQRGLEPVNIARQVESVRRTRDGVTTHLCGPDGAYWSPISVSDAIQQIKAGIAQYFTRVGDKVAFLEVVANKYLRTRPDAAPENNLDNLPSCQ